MPRRPKSDASSAVAVADRDRRIIQLVARFGQLSSSHIQSLLFPDTGRTPVDRALKRLVDRAYLIRIEQRLVGGSRGGSGQYVYSLGRRGFYMFYEGKYTPARAIRYHTLAIADCVVILRQLEREGALSVRGMSTEPDCWVTVGGYELKPDLYLDLEQASGRHLLLWLEIDMGSEGQRQLRAKMERYAGAWNSPSAEEWNEWPGVLWVAVDAERAKELSWIIGQLAPDVKGLFRVVELRELSTALR